MLFNFIFVSNQELGKILGLNLTEGHRYLMKIVSFPDYFSWGETHVEQPLYEMPNPEGNGIMALTQLSQHVKGRLLCVRRREAAENLLRVGMSEMDRALTVFGQTSFSVVEQWASLNLFASTCHKLSLHSCRQLNQHFVWCRRRLLPHLSFSNRGRYVWFQEKRHAVS